MAYEFFTVTNSNDPSFVAIPLILVTAPLSFLGTTALGRVGLLDPEGPLEVLLWGASPLFWGLLQAYVGWLILRGRRVVCGHVPKGGQSLYREGP